jgi:putative OPT family oligopeptide transporter
MADLKEAGDLKYHPYVPAETSMTEFSVKAIIYGLVMSVVLGAANAYLGLKAGMTIAATYPAAVISMALLRIKSARGTILEENLARTVGSIGESVAAGAIFTIPAFVISGVWDNLEGHYWQATAIMMLGGVIGVLFVTMLRRVMVEDVDLPFPESVAAGEIHKAGRAGGTGAIYLLAAGIAGALIQALKQMSAFASSWEKFIPSLRAGFSWEEAGLHCRAQGGLCSPPPA